MTAPILEAHEFAKLFPPLSEDDFKALVADIKANGLRQHIVCYQGKILDGNNRYRACLQAGIEPELVDLECSDDGVAQAFVISANIHRRHLSPEQRREIIATLLKAFPTLSNRQIAAQAKADHKTVGAVRAGMEATGEIPQSNATTGADGKARKRKGKPRAGGAKGEKEKITYQKVVNAKTALNAYGVLEEHLLDALQDVNDKTDLSQADEVAQATIEKLQDKLSAMQPEEATAS
jgi:ParB-like chromosome segregation protein Spo0J